MIIPIFTRLIISSTTNEEYCIDIDDWFLESEHGNSIKQILWKTCEAWIGWETIVLQYLYPKLRNIVDPEALHPRRQYHFQEHQILTLKVHHFRRLCHLRLPHFVKVHKRRVPSIIQSSSSKTVRSRCCRKARARSRKLHRSKNYQHRHVTLGESFKNFPVVRYHCLFDKAHPIVAYFSDATLYSIPEHGAGLCRAKYSTLYPCREPDVWSVEESNESSASMNATKYLEQKERNQLLFLQSNAAAMTKQFIKLTKTKEGEYSWLQPHNVPLYYYR